MTFDLHGRSQVVERPELMISRTIQDKLCACWEMSPPGLLGGLKASGARCDAFGPMLVHSDSAGIQLLERIAMHVLMSILVHRRVTCTVCAATVVATATLARLPKHKTIATKRALAPVCAQLDAVLLGPWVLPNLDACVPLGQGAVRAHRIASDLRVPSRRLNLSKGVAVHVLMEILVPRRVAGAVRAATIVTTAPLTRSPIDKAVAIRRAVAPVRAQLHAALHRPWMLSDFDAFIPIG